MTIQYKYADKFIFEPETFRLILKTKEIKLSHKESSVLALLCMNANKVVDRRTMLTEIWGDRESSDISLNKNILLLRRKFESIGIKNAIDTIPRIGYILKLEIEKLEGNSISYREDIPYKTINNTSPQHYIHKKTKKTLYISIITLVTTVALSILNSTIKNNNDNLEIEIIRQNKKIALYSIRIKSLKKII